MPRLSESERHTIYAQSGVPCPQYDSAIWKYKAIQWARLAHVQIISHDNLYDHTNAPYTHTVGVENNNNIAKRNYFSSNLHDVTGEVLKAEWRQEQTEKYKRSKRSYTKHNLNYWEKEINEKRKRQRQL